MRESVAYWWIVDDQVLPVTALSVASWCNNSGARRGRMLLASWDEAVALARLNWQGRFA